MQNKKKKLISTLLALIMLLGLIAAVQTAAGAADIQAGTPTFKLGTTDGTDSPTIVGFAGKQWAVIGHNGAGVASPNGTLTLLLANDQSYGETRFHADSNQYSSSDLKTAMDSAYNGISNAKEKDMVKARDLAGGSANWGATGYNPDNIAGPAVSGARFWPLSVAEADKVNEEVRKFTVGWWLRSPGITGDRAPYVINDGNFTVSGYDVNWSFGASGGAVRPAFNLNLSSVIFTSAAAGGKSGNVGANLSTAAEPSATDTVKFTAINSTLKLACTDTAVRTVKTSYTVNIMYSGATAGDNNYVSCVITDSTNKVLYYGKLAKTTTGMTGGTASFTVPALADGSYTIKLFSEEANGDNYTDFCSEPINIPMTVSATAAPFTAVTDITGLPVSAVAGAPLMLTGTVVPAEATNKTVKWSIKNAGTTGAKIAAGTNDLETTAAGAVVITATVEKGFSETAAFTKDFAVAVTLSDTPAITGSISMTLKQGYAATSSEAFTITGDPAPTVTKTSGDAKITWNDTTKKLDIAAGLTAGTYQVILKAANGKTPDAMFTFTLTVTPSVFIAITEITGLPTIAVVAMLLLMLVGTVVLVVVIYKTIKRSVKNAGTTNAKIAADTNVLETTTAGAAVITAAVEKGLSETAAFTDDSIGKA